MRPALLLLLAACGGPSDELAADAHEASCDDDLDDDHDGRVDCNDFDCASSAACGGTGDTEEPPGDDTDAAPGDDTDAGGREDVVVIAGNASTDLLLVVDNSASATDGQERLAAQIAPLLTVLTTSGVPWHVGVVTTDTDDLSQNGKLQGADGYTWLDGTVAAPLRPGPTTIDVRWQQPDPLRIADRVPEVRLGGPAVNVTIAVVPSPDRWIVALRGPPWGPVPLFWGYLVLVAIAAPLLSRMPYTPLGSGAWFLLGLGMTQLPIPVVMIVPLTFLALGWRRAHPAERPIVFNLGQLTLLGAALVALGVLYASIHAGLLLQPDMEVRGAGSTDDRLQWLVDRTDGALPTPLVVTLPLWTFRVAMLLWALWLAASLVRWGPWAWACWTEGGAWRAMSKPPASPAG